MSWTGTEREFRQVGREHTIVWKIKVDGATSTVTWGALDGKLQKTTNPYAALNEGKKNEVTPRANALSRSERKILMKTREGFVEYVGGVAQSSREQAIHPDKPLPENLTFYKPSNTLSVGMQKKARQGEVLFTRKRDGSMFVIRTTNDDVEFYSRRMQQSHHLEKRPWGERFGHLYEEYLGLLQSGRIPPNSLILGELVSDKEGKDDLSHVQSVLKSLTDDSVERQKKGGYLSYYAFDVAQWDGDLILTEKSLEERHALLDKALEGTQWFLTVDSWDFEVVWEEGIDAVMAAHPDWVFQKKKSEHPTLAVFSDGGADVEFLLDELALQIALRMKWEGWVVVDPHSVMSDKAMNYRGKADRPSKSSGKLKPLFEDDFIVEWDPDSGVGAYGSGKNHGLVGALALYQLNKDMDMVYISDVTGGIKDRHSKDYPAGLLRADLSDKTTFPLVAEVAYVSRSYNKEGDKTNALIFARILRFRDDKGPEECINTRL